MQELRRLGLEEVLGGYAPRVPVPWTSSGAIGKNRCEVARSVNADRKSVYAQCSSSIEPSAKSAISVRPTSSAFAYGGTSLNPCHSPRIATPRNRK